MGSSTLSEDGWRDAWEKANTYRGFLGTVARHMRWLSAEDGSEDAEDLLQGFLVEALPHIASRLDALASEADRERYLVVSFRNYARSHRRSARRYRSAIAAFGADRGVDAQEQSENPPVQWDALPSALQAFWSHDGDIRAMARDLGVSRYAARKAVVDAALVTALRLGESGSLTVRETAVCREILLQGRSISDTADVLQITETQVRNTLSSARRAIGSAFQR